MRPATNSLVIPLTNEPGTDMYYHYWLTIKFDFTFDPDYSERVLEPIIKTVPFRDYDYEHDKEIDLTEYAEAIKTAFFEKAIETKVSFARMAFPEVA